MNDIIQAAVMGTFKSHVSSSALYTIYIIGRDVIDRTSPFQAVPMLHVEDVLTWRCAGLSSMKLERELCRTAIAINSQDPIF